MTRPDSEGVRRGILAAVGSALIYMLADIPVQATRFLTFGTAVGIKNFLPPVLGIILGPAGPAGCVAGCVAGAVILSTPAVNAAAECVSILICGLCAWVGWHLRSDGILMKKPVDYLRFFVLLAVPAAISGVVWRLLAGPGGVALAVTYVAAGLLVGIPVLILAGSVFCIEPVPLPGQRPEHQAAGEITSDADSIAVFNDLLEEKLLLTKRVNMKRLFELQNVVEEVSLRVLGTFPDAVVQVSVDCHDSCSVKFSYAGAKYSPLKMGRGGDEVDMMSLKLIRHRALRASHVWSGGMNRVHIVL